MIAANATTPDPNTPRTGGAASLSAADIYALAEEVWADAAMAAALLAIDPLGLGGAWLKASPGPAAVRWVEGLQRLLPTTAPTRVLPASADADRIMGGIDLAATLKAGKPVMSQGMLAAADGGVLIVPMAERLGRLGAAAIASAMDQGVVRLERHGLSRTAAAAFALVLRDEGANDAEQAPSILVERLAFRLPLDIVPLRISQTPWPFDRADIDAARGRLVNTSVEDDVISTANEAAAKLGVRSLRVLKFMLAAARAHAALQQENCVTSDDIVCAARLILGLASSDDLPPPSHEEAPTPETDPSEASGSGQEQASPPPPPDTDNSSVDETTKDRTAAEDRPIEAARAAPLSIAAGLLSGQQSARRSASSEGRVGALTKGQMRGRVVGTAPKTSQREGRLDLIATLRTAAPWQKIRAQQRTVETPAASAFDITFSDVRFKQYQHKRGSSVIFVIDASGSSAMARMAEAKGAIEGLLAECYARRDTVSVVAFKGEAASLLLPPTSSVVRVRRSLSGLPGGGGTPLASGLRLALETAISERERGRSPLVVVLTDAQANIALDGTPGRPRAQEDAQKMAALLGAEAMPVLFFDTSLRSNPKAQELCARMGGKYALLPFADRGKIQRLVSSERQSLAPRAIRS